MDFLHSIVQDREIGLLRLQLNMLCKALDLRFIVDRENSKVALWRKTGWVDSKTKEEEWALASQINLKEEE